MTASSRQDVPPGCVIFRQGDPARYFFLLLSGRVRLYSIAANGKTMLHRVLHSGDIFGFQSAVRKQLHYPVSAATAAETEILRWDGATMRHLLHRYSVLAYNAFSIVSERMYECQERLSDMATENVSCRVARCLLRLMNQIGQSTNGHVTINGGFSADDLAGMAGTNVYTLSRILAGWQRQQIVRTGRRRIRIELPAKLWEVAGFGSIVGPAAQAMKR